VSDERCDETGRPVPRSRSGVIGRRRPRTGTEPSTARSPLRLRLLLSAVFLPFFVAAAALLGLWAARSDPGEAPGRAVLVVLAAASAAFALTTAADLLVVAHRLRRERRTETAVQRQYGGPDRPPAGQR
jgi:hypothetical protein